MSVLRLEDMGGKPYHPAIGCGCESSCNCSTGATSGRNYLTGPSSCGPQSPGNDPVEESTYRCSVGVRLQSSIDGARRIAHTLGFRPYRVRLVWQQRGLNMSDPRAFGEFHSCELMPVKVLTMDSVEIVASNWGEDLIGGVAMSEISPQQVTEDTLRGHIDGHDWVAADPQNREFFFEVALQVRCDGDLKSRRRRFIYGAESSLAADQFQFKISLVQQNVERSRDGVDQTIGTVNKDGTPLPPNGPRLVT